ncbi:zinc ribbon-containing protein [Rheinheimera sp. MMS21-TC3]|uniref:zinc ribbon-containing protein n=1 Tax=Rheinheimera sp. MMS21-TC3 TaxID=3072790 RepID=UPI0028C4A409|nr:hypothetical protein [Rheinheimera sp. MMS21-TC3]WNO62065.1 hypothetical protein RDV63_14240 [Rheinheimera sp. MMS21-TC3]
MQSLKQKYQQWLTDFTNTLQQAEQRQLDNMINLVEQLKAYIKAGQDLSVYETDLFIETLKRQWQEHADAEDAPDTVPSFWPEALWQALSAITDKSQVEWQELAQDFKHKGIYHQGEVVGMARYRCTNCLQHIDYTHPSELVACTQCGGIQFHREGLPV